MRICIFAPTIFACYILIHKIINSQSRSMFALMQPHLRKRLRTAYALLERIFLIRGNDSLQLPKGSGRTEMFENHCSPPRVSSLVITSFYIVLVRGRTKYSPFGQYFLESSFVAYQLIPCWKKLFFSLCFFKA